MITYIPICKRSEYINSKKLYKNIIFFRAILKMYTKFIIYDGLKHEKRLIKITFCLQQFINGIIRYFFLIFL